MRSMKIRSQLVLLLVGNLLVLLALSGAAAWMAGAIPPATETLWPILLGVAATLLSQLLLTLAVARRISGSTAWSVTISAGGTTTVASAPVPMLTTPLPRTTPTSTLGRNVPSRA